jgi:DNA repair exonuclease SbcCD ATPase subunit
METLKAIANIDGEKLEDFQNWALSRAVRLGLVTTTIAKAGSMSLAKAVAEEVVQQDLLDEVEDKAEQAEVKAEETPEQKAEVADEEVVITIGDAAEDEDSPPEDLAPTARDAWARMRIAATKAKKEARELRARLDAMQQQAAPAEVVVGPMPKIADFDYDEEKHEAALEAWAAKKGELAAQKAAREADQAKQKQQWQGRIDAVKKAAETLNVRDYEEAAEEFSNQFSMVQQGIVMGGPDDPKTSALLRHALGTNTAVARKMAAISDPVKFTFALAKLEAQLKVTPKKSVPPPESVVRSSVAGASSVDNQLEKLRSDADKTGDRSKVIAYMRQQALKK